MDDLLEIGLESPAAAIFRQIMRDNQMDGGLVDASRSKGTLESSTPKAGVVMTSDQFRAAVAQAIALWTEPPSKSLEPLPRYLNAGFFQANSGQPVPIQKPLSLDDGPYRLVVNISPTFWGPGAGDAPFPDWHLAEPFHVQSTLEVDVVVHSDKIQVTPSQRQLALPPKGESTLIYFDLTLREEGRQTLSIDLLYHGHLLQSRRIEVEVVAHAGVELPASAWPVQNGYMTWTRTAVLTSDDLQPLPQNPRKLTIVLDRQDDQVAFRFYDNAGHDLGFQEYSVNDGALANLMKLTREDMAQMMEDYGGYVGWDLDLMEYSLAVLAEGGYAFYLTLFPTLANPQSAGHSLSLDLTPGQVIQVARLSTHLSVPWEVLYERRIESFEEGRIKLCRTFRTHGPEPEACPAADDPTIVCPHGFWGYRYIIEQLPGRVQKNTTSRISWPLQIRNEVPLRLNAIVYSEFPQLASHLNKLRDLAGGNIQLVELSDKDAVRDMFKDDKNPADVIYFYTHGGIHRRTSYLAVGATQRIKFHDLNAWQLDLRHHQPLIILNACESAAYSPDRFENLLQSFCDKGAAGVIGTQCEVRELLADAFIRLFFKDFLKQLSVGEALYNARRALLFNEEFAQKPDPRGLVYSLFAAADIKLAQPILF